jgi:hypothetical protein
VCDLDQVAAGVVEYGSGDGSHLDRVLRELHAELLEPFELVVDIVDGE